MSLPLDQNVVDALQSLLAEIRVDNGYLTDAGEYVLVEQTRQEIPKSAITLAVVDVDERTTANGQKFNHRQGTLTVIIEIAVPVSEQAGGVAQWLPERATARRVMADVRRAIGRRKLHDYSVSGQPTFPAGITGIAITGRSMPPLAEGAEHLTASVDLEVSFNEAHLPKE